MVILTLLFNDCWSFEKDAAAELLPSIPPKRGSREKRMDIPFSLHLHRLNPSVTWNR